MSNVYDAAATSKWLAFRADYAVPLKWTLGSILDILV